MTRRNSKRPNDGRARRRAKAGSAAIICSLFWCATVGAEYGARPAVQEYIDGLVAEHGFDRAWLADVLAKASRDDEVIARISRPAEKALAWHEYRRIFITDERIDAGVEFWRRQQAVLDRAQREYGVSSAMIVAIIGVETYYGRILGRFPVLNALATLAFDYPPRSAFFTGQLTEYLLLVREEEMDPLWATGSYAGAMGYGQFIPSSYRAYAVDFDGDGRRDIWANEVDAIGSVANYFARHGWRGTGVVAQQVTLTGADAEAASLASVGLDLSTTVGELRRKGVTGVVDLADAEPAALFRMVTEDGHEYWLGLHDFYVITRYNRSAMYALAVLQLSEAITKRFEDVDAGT